MRKPPWKHERWTQWFWFTTDDIFDSKNKVLLKLAESDRFWEGYDWVEDKVSKLECKRKGHEIERDQCGRPEHDFCLWCKRLFPGQAKLL